MTDLREAAERMLWAFDRSNMAHDRERQLKLAAENLRSALELAKQEHSEAWWKHEVNNAFANGYEKGRASAAQPEQEPVAWMHTTATGDVYFRKKPHDKVFNPQPVYTAPPQREWQGLTDEEIKSVQRDAGVTYFVPADYDRHLFTHITDEKLMKIARAIEAKLKEKNA